MKATRTQDSRLRRHALSVLLVSLLAPAAHASGPLDFGYAVDGPPSVRPVLVFNDGTDTYIQPAPGIPSRVKGAIQDGPYFRIPGMPASLLVQAGRYSMAVTHVTPPAPAPERHTAQPFAQGYVPSIAPQSMRGPAQGAAVPSPAALQTATVPPSPVGQPGPALVAGPVVTAAAPAAASNPAADAIERTAMAIAARDAATASVSNQAATPAVSSLLALNFGAQAIRDGDARHTEIRFAARPTKDLVFVSADGHSLNPAWDNATNVVTIDRVNLFSVSDGKTTVDVARTETDVYDFDADNAAHLEGVFSKSGATYFKFGSTTKRVSVVDVKHAGTGTQKGHYFKFSGTADQFIVTADGNTANVTRRTSVTYYDRAAKQS